MSLYVGDRTPYELRFDDSESHVVNRYGHRLWAIPQWGDTPYTSVNAKICDLYGDGEPEVLFIPSSGSVAKNAGWLHVYSSDGDSLMALDGRICQIYPGDTVACSDPFGDLWCGVFTTLIRSELRVVSVVNRNSPGRCYIKIWDTSGKLHGWYINSGASRLEWAQDITGDGVEEFFFTGFANRMDGCATWFLPSESAYGVSPPYTHEPGHPDLTQVLHGNQIKYTLILPSDLANILSSQEYQGGLRAESTEGKGIRIRSGEGNAPVTRAETWLFYNFDNQFRLQTVSMDDHFKKQRRSLVEQGQLPKIDENTYLDSLACKVTYWMDSSWVTEGQLRDAAKQQP
ncbi:MAG: hypothetical protein IPH75_10740 [bacterium]|nr:hypothetical protein [bacterium]